MAGHDIAPGAERAAATIPQSTRLTHYTRFDAFPSFPSRVRRRHAGAIFGMVLGGIFGRWVGGIAPAFFHKALGPNTPTSAVDPVGIGTFLGATVKCSAAGFSPLFAYVVHVAMAWIEAKKTTPWP